MYYCQDCGCEFDMPEAVYETHSLSSPPYERFYVCPSCKSTSFREKLSTHCRCCGRKLADNQTDYCSSECRDNGRKLWEAERRRRRQAYSNPISVIIRETEEYNKKHGTKYSYGQYVALIRPEVCAID